MDGTPVVDGEVVALARDRYSLIVAGYFDTIGGERRGGLARVYWDGTVAPWAPALDGWVYALAVRGGRVHAGGDFVTVDDQLRPFLVEFDEAGQVTAWEPSPDGAVGTLNWSDGTLFAAGAFELMGETPRQYAAAFAPDGTLLPFDPQPNYPPSDLVAAGDTVYMGGYFTGVAGTWRRHGFAAVDRATGALLPLDPVLAGADVIDLAVSGDHLYLTNLGGSGHDGWLERVGIPSGTTSTWRVPFQGTPYVVAIAGERALVGGDIHGPEGAPRPGLAALTPGGETQGTAGEDFDAGSATELPLIAGDRELGALAVCFPGERTVSADDRDYLAAVAGIAALALAR